MRSNKDVIRVSASVLRDFTTRVLSKAGMPEKDAELTAESLIFANLRGIDTHGVTRLDSYVNKLILLCICSANLKPVRPF